MNHNQIEQLISQFIDNELPPEDSATMFVHLGGCESCRNFFQRTLQLRSVISLLPAVGAPSTLDARVHRIPTISPTLKPLTTSFWNVNFSIPLPAAASIAFLLIVGTLLISPLVFEPESQHIRVSDQALDKLPPELRSQLQQYR